MLRKMSEICRDEFGGTLAIMATALVPLTVLIGSGLDLGITYMARAKMQNACDAAVLAARQQMTGNTWNTTAENEANRFFEFNFPDGTHGVEDPDFDIAPNTNDIAELVASASGEVPTSLMFLFGFDSLPIAVTCDAKRDLGHNDIMLVLDTTGSMADNASGGGGSKISRLRNGAIGIYRGLEDTAESVTRFGILPYSHTVNVARSLTNNYILASQQYVDEIATLTSCGRRCSYYVYSYTTRTVNIQNSSFVNNSGASTDAARTTFRTNGLGCIEERPSIGNAASPVRIANSVSRADIDNPPTSSTDTARQFGIYDPTVQEGESQSGCPNEATRLQEYATEAAFQTAINNATSRVTGGTYHDVGMLWGARFISSTGFFSAQNPTQISNVPVNKHIVFMTDGILDTGDRLYSAHGIELRQTRTTGTGTQREKHIARFNDVCNLAKSMGITIWVIALDVGNTADIEPCATSTGHFFTSDGSDLQTIFQSIGQGIGNLRLTR